MEQAATALVSTFEKIKNLQTLIKKEASHKSISTYPLKLRNLRCSVQ